MSNYNASGQGIKHDTGKLQWNLLPLHLMAGVVRVLEFGAKKYAAWNWRKGMPHSQTYNACLRHLSAWAEGEDLDPESGLPHLDHAHCCLLFLRTHTVEHPEFDDRYRAPISAAVKAFLDSREPAP